MAAKKENIEITIRPVKETVTRIAIVGDTPLIVHAWSEKAKRLMLEAQMKIAKTKKAREAKDPFADFIDSMYWLSEKPEDKTPEGFAQALESGARFGFPVTGIKQAAISSVYRAGMVKDMASMRGAFFLRGVDTEDGSMAEIEGVPEMREDMVRVGMGTADIRYRAMFREWRMMLELSHNDNGVYSLEQIVNAINVGGYMCGIGEWRPEKDGQYGRFHVEVEG